MDAEAWRRVEDLYHAAARLTGDERARFLDASCGGDDPLRAEVESLLAYEPPADAFIEAPALDVAARLMAGDWSNGKTSLSGTTIANFRILDKLGEGGMGVVYEAEDIRLGRRVALKFLAAHVGSNPDALARFDAEARAASALNHPNICTIHSVQDHGGRPFIEMERLEGETLRERITRGPLDINEVVSLALQIVDGLAAAHTRGIVHRDLTPSNVFCAERGVKILDFGIAKLEAASEADSGAVMGTASYMSPEQARGEPVDSRTDWFSLGAVLYEMATGQAPFQGPSASSIRQAILNAEPRPPRSVTPALPAGLERTILKALQKDRDRRYQHASELRADLERLQHQTVSRRRWRMGGAAIALLLVGGTIAYLYSPLGSSELFDSANLRLRQITHYASEYSVSSGAISADGRYVAYSDPGGIHVLEIATGESRRVPESENPPGNVRWDLSPGWIRDGSGFVVNLATDTASQSSVWMVAVSAAPRRLRDEAKALSVSPDGSVIAFAPDAGEQTYRSLWLMDKDGHGARKLFSAGPGGLMSGLAWSPDGSRVAYLRADDTGLPAIETRAIAGGPASSIVRSGESVIQGLAWLRDGRLLYSLRQTGTGTSAGTVPCTHWQMPIDTRTGEARAAATRLAGWLPQCVGPLSFSADSKRVLFLQGSLQDAIHIAELDGDGHRTAASRLTFTHGRNIPSGWTPDNQSLVYVSDGGGQPALVRQPINADTAQLITDQRGIAGAARLTPDGTEVLYLVLQRRPFSGGTQRVMRVPIAGGVSHEVVTGKFVDGGARCTVLPARLCAFAERSADAHQIVFSAIELPSARGRELARIDADINGDYRWALSPDGTRIAVLNASSAKIRVLSLAGRPPPHEFEMTGHTALGYVSWTSDGNRLLVPSINARGATLLSVDLQGNAQVVWQQPGALDISGIPAPDGRRVAVWLRGLGSTLWLAESP